MTSAARKDLALEAMIRSLPSPMEQPYLIRVFGVTEEQFEAVTNEDTACELLDEVLIVHSPATFEHEDVGSFLICVLRGYASELDLGQVTGSRAVLHLKHGRKVEPDILFMSKARERLIGDQVEGTADLVVEILSPSTRVYDLGEKREAYKDARTLEMWFIDLERRQLLQEVRDRRSYRSRMIGSGVVRSKALPGLDLPVDWLWRRPLPKPLGCLQQLLSGNGENRRGKKSR